MAIAPADPPSLIGRRIGTYTIGSLIGAGGMGEVYRARDTKLGRDVAIKVLPPRSCADPERRARFEREAQLLASLNHPNIARSTGSRRPTACTALVLELVEGDDAGRADRTAGRCPSTGRADDRAADRRGARGGARQRHHPPRSQAGQHQDHARRRR